MKIKRIHIRRFGIFRDKTLEKIAPGIVVIGGCNRAGKTTFLEILKHLPFGFNRVPFSEAKDFEVDADALLDGGELNIHVKGFAEPKIKSLAGDKEYTCEEVFKGLDRFTYQQLFTISLDELQKIPRSIDKKETHRLQSVLLGAGLSEVIQVPQIEEELIKDAKKIGGKDGRPNVGEFKSLYHQIKDGLNKREEALGQVEDYYQKQKELKEKEKRLNEIENGKIPEKENEVIKLQTLSAFYDVHEEAVQLEQEIENHAGKSMPEHIQKISSEKVDRLKKDYQEVLVNYKDSLQHFKRKFPATGAQPVKEKLLHYKEKIEAFFRELSGLKEKTTAYIDLEKRCSDKEKEIKRRMNEVNEDWQEDFNSIRAIRTDEIQRDILSSDIKEHREALDNRRKYENDWKKLNDEQKRYLERYEQIKTTDPAENLKKYFIWSLLAVAAGSVLAFISVWLGILVGMTGVTGIALYSINKNAVESGLREQKNNLAQRLEDLEIEIDRTKKKLEEAGAKVRETKQKLDLYKEALGLRDEVLPDMLLEHFRDIQDLKYEINELENAQEKLGKRKEDLEKQFKEIFNVLKDMPEEICRYSDACTFEKFLQQKEQVFLEIEQLEEHLRLAEKLALSENAKNEKEKEILELMRLEKSEADVLDLLDQLEADVQALNEFNKLTKQYKENKDRILFELKKEQVRKAFAGSGDEDEDLIKAFEEFYNKYASKQNVLEALENEKENLERLKADLEELREENRKLRFELEQLSTTKKLEESKRIIAGARVKLRPLAEKYAVYKAAAKMLKKARENIIEKTKNKSLRQASVILSKITRGEYREIFPVDELTNPDFRVVLSDQKVQDSVDILSRATREQLFLAVRVNRIQEINPSLPVILDDSLVNFDMRHLHQTVEILADLSQTHQVFVLTCHPELVEYISRVDCGAQFWKIDNGEFSNIEKDELIEHLRKPLT